MLLDGKQIRDNSINLTDKAKSGPDVVIDLKGSTLRNIANPQNATDAATKEYVDALSRSSDYCDSVDHVTNAPTSAIPVSYKGDRVLCTNPGTPGIFEWNASQAKWVHTSDWDYVTSDGGATLVPCKDTKTIFIAQATDNTHATFTEIPQEQVTYTFGYGLKTSEDNDRILVQIDSSIVPSPEVIAALRNAINSKQNKLTSANAGTAIDFTNNKFNFRPAGDGYYIDNSNHYVLQYANENQSGILSASDYRAMREARRQNQASWEENDPTSSMYVQGRTHYYIPTVVFDTPVVVPTSSNVDLELLEPKAEIGDRLKLSTNEYGSIYGNIEADGTVTFEPTGSLIKGELLGSPEVLQIQNYGYVDLNIAEAYNMTKYSSIKKIDDIFLPAYEIQQVEPTSPDSSCAYALLKDGEEQGVKIEIPKDQVIEDAGSGVTTEDDIAEGGIFGPGTEYEGKFNVGDIYLWFEIYVGGSPSDKIIYVNVNKLVDIYVGDEETILIEPVGSGSSSMQISVIAEGVQSDWEEDDASSAHYIKNKPDIPTHTSDLINDGEGESPVSRFVTEDEIAQSDWEEDDATSPAHVLNRPAIRKGAGTNSIVEGDIENNTASGYASHAEGQGNTASNSYAHAEGNYTTASGYASHAEGQGNTASNSYAHAEGNYTTASGYASHAEGQNNTASNSYAHAEGNNTTASGYASHAEGQGSSDSATLTKVSNSSYTANGDYRKYKGTKFTYNSKEYEVTNVSYDVSTSKTTLSISPSITSSGNISVYFVTGIAANSGSHAEGYGTISTGSYTHAEGQGSSATDTAAHAEGYNSFAGGYASHAEGNNTKALGSRSHAEGDYTESSGYASHAEGEGTIASIDDAHAEGLSTIASGRAAHAHGQYTIANHASQTAIGEYNIADPSAASASSRGNYIEIVGNGTADSARSNARTLDWDGNEVLAGNLTVNGTTLTVNGQQIDLTNYYDKDQVDQMISAISSLKIQVVDVLPTEDIDTSTIYLVPMAGSPSEDNVYEEYIYIIDEEGSPIVGHWEMIGTAQVDLTDYMQKSNNLNDVADRQTALNNLTGAGAAQAGKYLKVDNNGNIAFGNVDYLTSQEIDDILI